jgi:twitching motility protein PilT
MQNLTELLDIAIERDASDIHLAANEPPILRLYGHLERRADLGIMTPEKMVAAMKAITPEYAREELDDQLGVDFGFAYGNKARFRVSVFKQKRYYGIVMRLIPYKLLTFEQLGLSEHVQELFSRPRGLVIVTGPTGCGKTTTLATVIDYINQNFDHHIITIEDPIEYYHSGKKSIVTQREVHVDVPAFDVGVIKSLRQDPDVILVGEMRDLRTIEAAVTAAETGHLVFSTLHTTGAAPTVDRIVDVFPVNQQEQIRTQLSGNLLAVISQMLLPRVGGGRCAVYEIMICTPAIQHLIRDKKTHSILSMIQTGVGLGMQTLDMHIIQRIQANEIREEDGLRVAQRPDEVMEKLHPSIEGTGRR